MEFAAAFLGEEFALAGVEAPVELAEVVAGFVGAVGVEFDAVAAQHAGVAAVDEGVGEAAADEFEVAGGEEDFRIVEFRAGDAGAEAH